MNESSGNQKRKNQDIIWVPIILKLKQYYDNT